MMKVLSDRNNALTDVTKAGTSKKMVRCKLQHF